MYAKGKREGEMAFLNSSILTENIGSRFRLVEKFRKRGDNFVLFYSAPKLNNLGKVSRYSTDKLLLFNETKQKLSLVKFDFSNFEDPMV